MEAHFYNAIMLVLFLFFCWLLDFVFIILNEQEQDHHDHGA